MENEKNIDRNTEVKDEALDKVTGGAGKQTGDKGDGKKTCKRCGHGGPLTKDGLCYRCAAAVAGQ